MSNDKKKKPQEKDKDYFINPPPPPTCNLDVAINLPTPERLLSQQPVLHRFVKKRFMLVANSMLAFLLEVSGLDVILFLFQRVWLSWQSVPE